MSKVIKLFFSVMFCGLFCSGGVAQECKNSAVIAWNEFVHYVSPGCAAEFPSPNHHLVLKFGADGTMSIKGMKIPLSVGLRVPTTMVSWSPKSNAFFINDGEGSGMTSKFRLFRIRGTKVYEDRVAQRTAVLLYRRRTDCDRSALDPDHAKVQ